MIKGKVALFSFVLFALSVLPVASASAAVKICSRKSDGKITLRERCKKSENTLSNLNMLVGTNGVNGADGASFYDVVPSGVTITGVIGGDFDAPDNNGDWRVFASFPAPIGRKLNNSDVIVANTSVVDNDCGGSTCLSGSEALEAPVCTGTTDEPTAPAGKVCIYPDYLGNATNIDAFAYPFNGLTSAKGFILDWSVSAPGDTYLGGSWAYTQP